MAAAEGRAPRACQPVRAAATAAAGQSHLRASAGAAACTHGAPARSNLACSWRSAAGVLLLQPATLTGSVLSAVHPHAGIRRWRASTYRTFWSALES